MKTKKVLLFASRTPSKKNDPIVFQKAMLNESVDCDVIFYEDLSLHLQTGNVSIYQGGEAVNLEGYTLVMMMGWYKNGKQQLYREFALSIAAICRHAGLEIWNSEVLQQRAMTKLAALVLCALDGLSIPESYYAFDQTKLTAQNVILSAHGQYIVKGIATSRGRDNYLFSDINRIDELSLELPGKYVIQKAIPNKGDYRIICGGSKPVLALYRERARDAETHLNNVSTGATATVLQPDEIPGEVANLASRAAKLLGRELGGVDILIDELTKEAYLLEVNPLPQLTSGAFVAEKLSAITTAVATYLETKKEKS